jgi:anti-sigma factor RsiW
MGAVRSAECERARLWVSVGIDGELSELGRASVRSHVRRCAACAEFQRETAALTREVRASPRLPVSISVSVDTGVDKDSTVVVQLRRRRRTTVRVLQACAAAAAVAVAAGLGSLVGSVSTPAGSSATATSAKTSGLDPGIVAMLPDAHRPALRTGRSVPV